jgi:hypothetical protein
MLLKLCFKPAVCIKNKDSLIFPLPSSLLTPYSGVGGRSVGEINILETKIFVSPEKSSDHNILLLLLLFQYINLFGGALH